MTTQTQTHTPGPWTVNIDGPDMRVFAGGEMLAIVNEFRDEAEANARLIASAPALKEALERLLPKLTTYSGAVPVVILPEYKAARAVLASIEGQS